MERKTHFNILPVLIFALVCSLSVLGASSTLDAQEPEELAYKKDMILKIIEDTARYEYNKFEEEIGYEILVNMNIDEFVNYCIATAKYEHRKGSKTQGYKYYIEWQKRRPDEADYGDDTYDKGVMQINSGPIGQFFSGAGLDWENNIYDNIRAGVLHLASNFIAAYSEGLTGEEAVIYGLTNYDQREPPGRGENVINFINNEILEFSKNSSGQFN